MSTYDDEMFKYLTKKENFISAYEIYQLFPEVKKTLVEKFWPSVKGSLLRLTEGTDWKIEMSEDIFETYSGIDLYCNDNIWVRIEKLYARPYYGLQFDEENKMLDHSRIRNYASNVVSMKVSNYKWWLCLEDTGYDFNNIETLKRILPENREDTAQELAKMLFDFGEELKEDILKMSKMTKKQA